MLDDVSERESQISRKSNKKEIIIATHPTLGRGAWRKLPICAKISSCREMKSSICGSLQGAKGYTRGIDNAPKPCQSQERVLKNC